MNKKQMTLIIILLVLMVISFLLLGRLLTLGVVILAVAGLTIKPFRRLWKVLGTKG